MVYSGGYIACKRTSSNNNKTTVTAGNVVERDCFCKDDTRIHVLLIISIYNIRFYIEYNGIFIREDE